MLATDVAYELLVKELLEDRLDGLDEELLNAELLVKELLE